MRLCSAANAVGSLSHGLTRILIMGGDATKKGTVALCNALKKNADMSRTLTVLNLGSNKLDRSVQPTFSLRSPACISFAHRAHCRAHPPSDGSSALAAFVSGPNVLKNINISGTNANLEMLLPAVMRGTQPSLSRNPDGSSLFHYDSRRHAHRLHGAGEVQHLEQQSDSQGRT